MFVVPSSNSIQHIFDFWLYGVDPKKTFQILVCVTLHVQHYGLAKTILCFISKRFTLICASIFQGHTLDETLGTSAKGGRLECCASGILCFGENYECPLVMVGGFVTGFAKSACLALLFLKNYITFAIVADVPIVIMDAKSIFNI